MKSLDPTESYYQRYAAQYFERTVGAQLDDLYDRVLCHVPSGGRILDAGCGSGRDLKAFLRRGYVAKGVDSSPALVQLAEMYSGAPCQVSRFQDLSFDRAFDAVWACASLLHVPKAEIEGVLGRLHRALDENGILLASVQAGEGERQAEEGRFYAYYTAAELSLKLAAVGFAVQEIWDSDDSLHHRAPLRWLNVIARRLPQASAARSDKR